MTASAKLTPQYGKYGYAAYYIDAAIKAQSAAYTLPERMQIGANALSTLEDTLDKLSLEVPQLYAVLRSDDFAFYSKVARKATLLHYKLKQAAYMLENADTEIESLLNKVYALQATANSYIARLKARRGGKYSWVYTWKPNDITSSSQKCYVASGTGLISLPQRNKVAIPIDNIALTSATIGVVRSGQTLDTLTDSDLISGFTIEADRKTGSCAIGLKLMLAQRSVVNLITARLLGGGQYVLESLEASAGSKTYSMKELLGTEQLQINVASGKDIEIPILPVEAETVRLQIRQEHPRSDLTISNIALYQVEYSSNGSLQSVDISLSQKLFVAEPAVALHNPLALDSLVALSVGTDTAQPVNASLVSLDEGVSAINWSLALTKPDTLLGNIKDTNKSYHTDAEVLGSVERLTSSLQLEEQRESATVSLLKETLLQRSFYAYAGTKIGTTTGNGLQAVLLADKSIELYGVQPEELSVRVGGIEYTYNPVVSSLTSNEWSLSDDNRKLYIYSTTDRQVIEVGITPLQARIIADAGEYIVPLGSIFSPEKRYLQVAYMSATELPGSMTLDSAKSTFKLEGPVTSLNFGDSTWTEVASKGDLAGATNSWYLDTANGILYLSNVPGDDTIEINYKYYKRSIIPPQNIKIAYTKDSNAPYGLILPAEALKGISYTDTVGSTLGKILDPVSGSYEARTSIFSSSTTKQMLSHKNIIKGTLTVSEDLLENNTLQPVEIEYIDGRTEFLGLEHIVDEAIPTLEGDPTTGEATFTLSRGWNWYPDYNVIFSDTTYFANNVGYGGSITNIGDYFIDNTGKVTVKLGSGVNVSDVTVSYYAVDPNFNPGNKYSVDYENGILYSYVNLVSGATISYQAATVVIGFRVAEPVNEFTVNGKTLEIYHTSEAYDRFIAVGPKTNSDKKLLPYYSPIVKDIKIGFY